MFGNVNKKITPRSILPRPLRCAVQTNSILCSQFFTPFHSVWNGRYPGLALGHDINRRPGVRLFHVLVYGVGSLKISGKSHKAAFLLPIFKGDHGASTA
jgi:hypothetical protein